jgi:hypothetical protein
MLLGAVPEERGHARGTVFVMLAYRTRFNNLMFFSPSILGAVAVKRVNERAVEVGVVPELDGDT